MIVSKANLQAINAVKKDKATPALYVLYLEKNGATFCVSQQGLMAVAPVTTDVKSKITFIEETRIDDERVIIHGSAIEDVLRNMPKDSLFGGLLEHCDIDNESKTSLSDGKRTKTIRGRKQRMNPMPYHDVIRKVLGKKQSVRSIVNLIRLKALLEAVEKACGDQSGELPIYIEFSDDNDLIIRAEHPRFGQRVLAIMTTYRGGEWMGEDQWEKDLKSYQKLPKKKKLILSQKSSVVWKGMKKRKKLLLKT